MILISAAAMIGCAEGGVKRESVPAIDTTNFDKSIALNEDFYEHATRGWQQKHPLKPEFSRYGSFDMLRETNEKQINELFQSMTSMKAEAGSVEQKISDLYKLGMDSVRLNEEALAPVKEDLAKIYAITDLQTMIPVLVELHNSVSNPLFGLGVDADLMNSTQNILYAQQSGLGMGNRDYYLDEENASKREGYVAFLTKAFELAEVEGAAEKAASVLDFETKMAKDFRSMVELRDISANYNPTTREAFVSRYDAIDWESYFAAVGIGEFEQMVVGQPEVLDAVNKLLKSTSIEVVKDYLAAGYLRSAASYLNDELNAASFDFFGRQMSGAQQQRPRWKRAMGVPNSILGEAVGKMYVAKYFPEEDKVRMTELVKNLQVALGQHIEALEWMSDETKARAQEKLAAFTVKIGYPDKWKDYSSLEIDPTLSYWENIKRANAWYTADNFAKLGKPVDRDEWFMSPQTVNAYYNPTTNEICFPAAILQPPFYNSEADDAVNYGAIGVVIGHEMTHGFDDQGRQFDKDGNLNDWWTAADAAAFNERADKLVAQFDAIEVLAAKEDQPAIFANGRLSLGENIADQGGLRVAMTALRNSLEGKETPAPIDGYTAEQRFYLSYATLWAQNIRDEEIARLTKVDVHSLGKNRVNATLRNIEDFYTAFSIEDGAMFMPVEERVVIW